MNRLAAPNWLVDSGCHNSEHDILSRSPWQSRGLMAVLGLIAIAAILVMAIHGRGILYRIGALVVTRPLPPFVLVAGMLLALLGWSTRGRRYVVILSLTCLLAIANLYSSSIPTSFYHPGFGCTYLEAQYRAIVDGVRAIRDVDPGYLALVWYRRNETEPFVNPACRGEQIGKLYYGPQIALEPLYGAIWGERYETSLVYKDSDQGIFGGYLATTSFSEIPGGRDAFHGLPDPFRLAIFTNDPAEETVAIHTLGSYGAGVQVVKRLHVREGDVSFDTIIVDVRKPPRS